MAPKQSSAFVTARKGFCYLTIKHGLVVTSLPKVPIWKAFCFNGLRFTQYGNKLI